MDNNISEATVNVEGTGRKRKPLNKYVKIGLVAFIVIALSIWFYYTFFEIVKKNIETSFMNVYISDGKGTLDVAYTSNNETKSISLNNPIFDFLLNIDKSVIIYSAIEKEHALSPMENELKKFFSFVKSPIKPEFYLL